MKSRRKAVAQQGFTLIELIVVIAIMVILAAILFPVFARTKENARRMSCVSNLRQLTLGIQQYVQDNDGTFPVYSSNYQVDSSVPGGVAYYGWANLIYPYVKSLQVYQCPSEKHPINPGIKKANWLYVYNYTDYAYNTNFSWTYDTLHRDSSGFSPQVRGGIRESKLSAPAVTVILQDSVNGSQDSAIIAPTIAIGTDYTFDSNGVVLSSSTSTGPMAMQRHFDGANYAMADGHVKWFRHISLSRGYTGYRPTSYNYSAPYPASNGNAQPPDSLRGYAVTYATNDY